MCWFTRKSMLSLLVGILGVGLLWGCTPDLSRHSVSRSQTSQHNAGKDSTPRALPIPSVPQILKLPGLSIDVPHVKPVTPFKQEQIAATQRTASVSPLTLIAHEWGTYTSVSSSDGREMEGLQHEEEKLPSFVHRRGQYVKGIEATPLGVTQKLETPVIYFYTQKATQIQVKVDFPTGIISEWYPEATRWLPDITYQSPFPKEIFKNGSMTWDVQVDPALTTQPAHVPPENIWAPSRQVAATPLINTQPVHKKEVEKFIFYRGLGRFHAPFVAKATADGKIHITNQSSQPIPAIFLLRVTKQGAAFAAVGGLKGQGTQTYLPPTNLQAIDSYIKDATSQVALALEKTGLYKDEAWAMVNTWRHSYFKSPAPGLRILYIAPRAWTDTLLPISITPKPTELVRTLVGRVELLTPQGEAETLQQLKDAYRQGMTLDVTLFGRFAEAKLRRALEQITDNDLKAYVQNFVAHLAKIRYQ